jgi:methylmalonyl-CoA/ethylmalonyl-CoA epimerase
MLQVALAAEDQDRAAAFYSELLGTPPAGRFGSLLFFRVGEVRLLLEAGAPAALIYLLVPDLDAALAALPEGAVIVERPRRIFVHPDDSLGPAGTEEWHAAFRDPEGNSVVFVAQLPA